MASRRDLKKRVKSMCEVTVDVCYISMLEHKDKEKELYEVIDKVYDLEYDIVCRISHTEPGNVKMFYKKLNEDFAKGINDAFARVFELES